MAVNPWDLDVLGGTPASGLGGLAAAATPVTPPAAPYMRYGGLALAAQGAGVGAVAPDARAYLDQAQQRLQAWSDGRRSSLGLSALQPGAALPGVPAAPPVVQGGFPVGATAGATAGDSGQSADWVERMRPVAPVDPMAREQTIGQDLWEGAQNTASALQATGQMVGRRLGLGGQDLLAENAAAQAQRAAEPVPAYYQEWRDRLAQQNREFDQAQGFWPSVAEGADVVGAALSSPRALGHELVKNIPFSAPAMAGGALGAMAGASVGGPLAPVTALAGGALGALLGGLAPETGAKYMEEVQNEAQRRGFDPTRPESIAAVMTDGDWNAQAEGRSLLKGSGIAAVDAATMLVGGRLFSAPAHALESAVHRAGARLGLDLASDAGRAAARQSPEFLSAIAPAEAAYREAMRLPRKAGRTLGAFGMETLGEGAGEALGQYLADGKIDAADVVLESILGGVQSGAQVGIEAAAARVGGPSDAQQIARDYGSLADAQLGAVAAGVLSQREELGGRPTAEVARLLADPGAPLEQRAHALAAVEVALRNERPEVVGLWRARAQAALRDGRAIGVGGDDGAGQVAAGPGGDPPAAGAGGAAAGAPGALGVGVSGAVGTVSELAGGSDAAATAAPGPGAPAPDAGAPALGPEWAADPLEVTVREGRGGLWRREVVRSADGSRVRERVFTPDGSLAVNTDTGEARDREVPFAEFANAKAQELGDQVVRWRVEHPDAPEPKELADRLAAARTERDRWAGLAAPRTDAARAAPGEVEQIKTRAAKQYLRALATGKGAKSLLESPELAFLRDRAEAIRAAGDEGAQRDAIKALLGEFYAQPPAPAPEQALDVTGGMNADRDAGLGATGRGEPAAQALAQQPPAALPGPRDRAPGGSGEPGTDPGARAAAPLAGAGVRPPGGAASSGVRGADDAPASEPVGVGVTQDQGGSAARQDGPGAGLADVGLAPADAGLGQGGAGSYKPLSFIERRKIRRRQRQAEAGAEAGTDAGAPAETGEGRETVIDGVPITINADERELRGKAASHTGYHSFAGDDGSNMELRASEQVAKAKESPYLVGPWDVSKDAGWKDVYADSETGRKTIRVPRWAAPEIISALKTLGFDQQGRSEEINQDWGIQAPTVNAVRKLVRPLLQKGARLADEQELAQELLKSLGPKAAGQSTEAGADVAGSEAEDEDEVKTRAPRDPALKAANAELGHGVEILHGDRGYDVYLRGEVTRHAGLTLEGAVTWARVYEDAERQTEAWKQWREGQAGAEAQAGADDGRARMAESDAVDAAYQERHDSLFADPERTVSAEKDAGTDYLPQTDADALVASWERYAEQEGKRLAGAGKVILSLFDYSGQWSQPWQDAGYEVVRVDLKDGTDIADFSVEYLSEHLDLEGMGDVVGVLAACPCTDFASSGARWFQAKDADGRTAASVELVRQTKRTIEYFNPDIWAIENPIGRIRTRAGLPAPRLYFQPHNYGNPYTKKTQLFGQFATDLPLANVDPVQGSLAHKLSSDAKAQRELTPKGFAYAFFMANHPRVMAAHGSTAGAYMRAMSDALRDAVPEHWQRDPTADEGEAPPASTDEQIKAVVALENHELGMVKISAELAKAEAELARVSGGNGFGVDADQGLNQPLDGLDELERQVKRLSTREHVRREETESAFAEAEKVTGDVAQFLREHPNIAPELSRLYSSKAPKARTARDITDAELQEIRKVAGYLEDVTYSIGEVVEDRKVVVRLASRFGKSGRDSILMAMFNIDRDLAHTVNNGLTDRRTPNRLRAQDIEGLFEEYPALRIEVARVVDEAGGKVAKPGGGAAALPAGKTADAEYGATNTLVSRERAAELRARLKKKLGEVRSGIDPELLAIGVELGAFHIEAGARRFGQFARAIADDLGESMERLRPYLRSWYNGARDMMEDAGRDVADMDGPEVVREEMGKLFEAPAGPAEATLETGQAEETGDDDRGVRGEGAAALGGVAAGDDGAAAGERPVRDGGAGGGAAGAQGDAGADAGGLPGPRGGGGGARGTRVPAARDGRPQRRSRRGTGGQRGGVSGDAAGAGGDRPQVRRDGVAVAPPQIPGRNFTITEEVALGEGGEVQKFSDNLAAIRTLRTIEVERRRASPEEQRILARYVGWGGLKNAFADDDGGFQEKWEKRGRELAELLTPEELRAARRSTRNAHYTSKTVAEAMWSAAQRLGFRGGLMLESSAGVGNFLGLMPAALRGDTRAIAVEVDGLSARIAAALYPQTTVLNSGFQRVPVPEGEFDLAIGNPPFGEEGLTFQYLPAVNGYSIHNQFMLANLAALRPGGLQVMVVSRFFMDGTRNAEARQAMARQAELLGAIRLPDTAFKENARSEVVTDILLLKRRPVEHEQFVDWARQGAQKIPDAQQQAYDRFLAAFRREPDWMGVTEVADPLGAEAIPVNAYFQANPEMMLGSLERSGTMRHADDVTLRALEGSDLAADLAAAIERFPRDVMERAPDAIETAKGRYQAMAEALKLAVAGAEPGALYFDEAGALTQVLERETRAGDWEMTTRAMTADAPWSERLQLDADGHWFEMVAQVGDDGKPQKSGRRNLYTRKVYATDAEIPDGLRLGATRLERVRELVTLRDLLRRQLELETKDASARTMEENRDKLRVAYRAFVARHGLINDPKTAALVGEMPDGALVLALEHGYKAGLSAARAKKLGEKAREASARPAEIMERRVVVPYEPPTRVEAMADALALSLAETGRVDLARIAGLLGTDEAGATARLTAGETPLAYFDPELERWETREQYLSGPVRRKLEAARAAGLEANIQALEAVQPEPWTADQVTPRLGANWIDPGDFAAFIEHLAGGMARVLYSALTNSYQVVSDGQDRGRSVDEWGVPSLPAPQIVEHILNSKTIRIGYTDDEGKFHLDSEQTELANLRARLIGQEFQDWVFADAERRARLVGRFNDRFNTRKQRQYDGSHMQYPGKVPDQIIAMRRHQDNAVWRGIVERFVLYDHVVGAGKTFTAIARAMERRRMGLSRKPMIAVPNHLVEQWAADVYRLYPGAKVLAAGKRDFERKRRRRLFAKIATGDWDIVIVPHSSFGFLGISQETEERYLREELRIAQEAIREAEAEAAELGLDQGRRRPFNVKEAERLAVKIEERLARLGARTGKDRLLTFEQLGVDDLTVDEAHEFKNLYFSSRLTKVRGMGNKTGSGKAFDLYNKVRVLHEHPSGSVVFMTGTPISNSAVEMYTLMRYLVPQELRDLGLEHFDAWRAQYSDVRSRWAPTESGRLEEVNRLGPAWNNMRSLMDLYYAFADVVSLDDIRIAYAQDNAGARFPVPEVKGGERRSIVIQPTEGQGRILQEVLEEFAALPNEQDPFERNKKRLRAMDKARKVSLDVRVVNPSIASAEQGGKLDVAAQEIARIYKAWSADRGTQLVFLDRSTPRGRGDSSVIQAYDTAREQLERAFAAGDEAGVRKAQDKLDEFNADEIEAMREAQRGGWNAYQQLKDNLVKQGIPANEIRFIQEANNDAQKKALIDQVNLGEVRVLIGSTPRMGAGTNAQERLVGLHHLDVNWKPSDIEQREGRIIRQGNSLLEKYGDGFEVEVLAYVTERTIDAKMWDLNAEKLRNVNGIRKYDGEFEMDFNDDEAAGMATIAALASGEPLLLERVQLTSEIERFQLLERAHRRREFALQDRVDELERKVANLPRRIESLQRVRSFVNAQRAAERAAWRQPEVNIEGTVYTSWTEANEAANAAIKAQKGDNPRARFTLVVDGEPMHNVKSVAEVLSERLESTPFVFEIDGERLMARGAAQKRVDAAIDAWWREAKSGDEATLELGTLLGARVVADVLLRGQKMEGNTTEVELSLVAPDGYGVAETVGRNIDALRSKALGHAGESPLWEVGDLERAKAELPEARARLGKPFAQAGELREKTTRLEEVIRALSDNPVAHAVAAAEGDGPAQAGPAAGEQPEVVETDGGVRFHLAWHGSPHEFDAFSLQKIGSGEGDQAYGWGLYFADSRGVAEYYRDALSTPDAARDAEYVGELVREAENDGIGGIPKSTLVYASRRKAAGFSKEEVVKSAQAWADRTQGEKERAFLLENVRHIERIAWDALRMRDNRGRLYEVELAPRPEEYLDWDKPISQQSENVRRALRELRIDADSGGMWGVFGEGRALGTFRSREEAERAADDYRELMDGVEVRQGGEDGQYAYHALESIANMGMLPKGQAAGTVPELVSKALAARGVPGIRFLDGSSRGQGEGRYNYVLFDDRLASVRNRYRLGTRALEGRPSAGAALSRDALQADLDHWTRGWVGLSGYRIRAVAREAQLPQAALDELKARRQEAPSAFAKAVFIPGARPGTGELVFVAAHIGSRREALALLMHEAGLHVGLSKMMGERLNALLDQVAAERSADVALIARRYGYAMGRADQRRAAAEEYLADLAETHQDMGLLRRIYAEIRHLLRAMGIKVRLRDADIDFVLSAARSTAREGAGGRAARLRAAYGARGTGSGAGAGGGRFAVGTVRGGRERVDYRRRADQAGSDADRALVTRRLEESLTASGLERIRHPRPLDARGQHYGIESAGFNRGVQTTKHALDRSLSSVRYASGVSGEYAYPIYESEAARFQRAGLAPFYADGGWWADAATVLRAARGGSELGALHRDILEALKVVDRRTPEVWEFVNQPHPDTALEYFALQPAQGGADSPTNPDIRFSLANQADDGGSPVGGGRRLRESIRSVLDGSGEWTGDRWRQALPVTLGAVTLRQLAELGEKHLPGLMAYTHMQQRMDTRRNAMVEESGVFASDTWEAWARKRENRAEADEVASLMHAATLAQVDPSEAYQPLQVALQLGPGELFWRTREATRENVRELKNQALRMARSSKTEDRGMGGYYAAAAKTLALAVSAEAERAKAWPELERRWAALSPPARAIFTGARDLYAKRSKEMMEALITRIRESAALDPSSKAALAAQIRQEFEQTVDERGNPRIGPYFPLQRFGRYYAFMRRYPTGQARHFRRQDGTPFASEAAARSTAGTRRDLRGIEARPVELADGSGWELEELGEPGFWMFESVRERRRALAQLREKGWQVVRQGLTQEARKDIEGVSEGFIAQAVAKLQGQGAEDEADMLYQMYLQTLHQMSIRKHFMHRKGTTGYSNDALRAFGWNMMRLAHQLAKLEYVPRLERVIREAEAAKKEAAAATPGGDATVADAFLEELKKRHQWVVSPNNASWTNFVSGLGFVWYLGVTPAAALVNLSQTPIVALPVLASKFGWQAASKALGAAVVDVGRGFSPEVVKGFLAGRPVPSEAANLSADERRAFAAWELSGVRDRTRAHNLAGIGDSDTFWNGPTFNRVMAVTSSLFHAAEVVNRDTTLLAGYRLARANGQPHGQAVQSAEDATWDSHFDYANSNRARAMQSNAAKALLMFRSYSQHMTYFLWRNLYQWTAGESPEVQREARTRLLGILGMTGLFAGTLGMPMLGAVFAAANLAAAAFGDDDEPWDAEIEFRNWLARTFPGTVAAMIDRGPANALTGMDWAARVSLRELWFRSPDRDLDGAGTYQHIVEQLLGPAGGIAGSPFTALDLIGEGHWERAAEAISPKFLKDALKSARYAAEGVQTKRGDPVVERDALGSYGVILKALGINPDQVAVRYDANNAVKTYERRILERRSRLISAYALASIHQDQEAMDNLQPKISAFNAAQPTLPITVRGLRTSVRNRLRYNAQAENGIQVNRHLERVREAGAFGE